MAPSMRSAAKAANEAIKAHQQPETDDNSEAGDKNMAPMASTEMQVPGTPAQSQTSAATPGAKSSAKKRKADDAALAAAVPLTKAQVSANNQENGRNLIPWQRPRMSDKLLLVIEFECVRQGIVLPWNDIAHRLHEGATGAGVQQHLTRLRTVLATEGHMIPPKLPTKRAYVPIDRMIRGYVRCGIVDDCIQLKPHKYGTPYEHLITNSGDAHQLLRFQTGEQNEQAHKGRKLTTADGASQAAKTKRRTRVPLTYLPVGDDWADVKVAEGAEMAPDDAEESDAEEVDSEDDENAASALANRPLRVAQDDDFEVRKDVPIEEQAMNIYTRNNQPRVFGRIPNPVYQIGELLMSYKQVCAMAVKFYNSTGEQHPECAVIIAQHAQNGNPTPLGHFTTNNFNHPVTQYPGLYTRFYGADNMPTDLPSPIGGPVVNDDPGLNGGPGPSAGHGQQGGPATPYKHQNQVNPGGGANNGTPGNSAGGMGSGPGIKPNRISPPDDNGLVGGINNINNPNAFMNTANDRAGVNLATPTKTGNMFSHLNIASPMGSLPDLPFAGFAPTTRCNPVGLHASAGYINANRAPGGNSMGTGVNNGGNSLGMGVNNGYSTNSPGMGVIMPNTRSGHTMSGQVLADYHGNHLGGSPFSALDTDNGGPSSSRHSGADPDHPQDPLEFVNLSPSPEHGPPGSPNN